MPGFWGWRGRLAAHNPPAITWSTWLQIGLCSLSLFCFILAIILLLFGHEDVVVGASVVGVTMPTVAVFLSRPLFVRRAFLRVTGHPLVSVPGSF